MILAAIRYHSLGKIPQSLEKADAPGEGLWDSEMVVSSRARFLARSRLEDRVFMGASFGLLVLFVISSLYYFIIHVLYGLDPFSGTLPSLEEGNAT